MARYNLTGVGKIKVHRDPKFDGHDSVQTGYYGFDITTETIAKNMKRLTVFGQYGGLSGNYIDFDFNGVAGLCRAVDGILSFKGTTSRIDRLIVLDHGFMLSNRQQASVPRSPKKVEIKGYLALGDGKLHLANLQPARSDLNKIARWCDSESHVVFLNCSAGLMKNLMRELTDIFGCRVTGPNQTETGLDMIHAVHSGYTYTTYYPNGDTLVTDERPF